MTDYLRTGYSEFLRAGSNLGMLFVRAFPNSIIKDYFLASVAPSDGDRIDRVTGSVRQLLSNLVDYGCVDHILWFALFLDRYDDSGDSLKALYKMLGEKTVFDRPMTEWCNDFLKKYRKCGNPNLYRDASEFICKKMLCISREQSFEEIEEAVLQKVNRDLARFSVASKDVIAAYQLFSCLGWLQYGFKHFENNNVLRGRLLMKLFTEMNASLLPETELRTAILSSLLESYVDASIVITSAFETYDLNGLGRAIFDFAQDAKKNNRALLENLQKNKASEWQALLYFATRQANGEGDYATAAELLKHHFEDARRHERSKTCRALLNTYLNVDDDLTALSLFSIIKREQLRDKGAFTDKENAAVDERFSAAVKHFVSESQNQIRSIKEDGAGGEDERVEALQSESDRYAQVTSFFPQGAFFEQKLNQSMRTFLSSNSLPYEDLLSHLGEKERTVITQYLRQGEMIYSLLKMLEGDRSDEEMYRNMDYSPALLQLTKALEYVGNLIYNKISTDLVSQHASFLDKNGNRQERITLGNFQSLFFVNVYPTLSYAGRKPDSSLTYLNDVIDITKYRSGETNGNRILRKITNDLEIPREARNNAAHKDPLEPDQYKSCEECLFGRYRYQKGNSYVDIQHVLWNILHMIKEGVVLTE